MCKDFSIHHISAIRLDISTIIASWDSISHAQNATNELPLNGANWKILKVRILGFASESITISFEPACDATKHISNDRLVCLRKI